MAKKVQQKKKSNMLNNIVFILVCTIVLVAFFRFMGHQSDVYNERRAQYEHFERQFADARAEYYALRYQIAHFDSDAYVERLARDRWGWARPNEIIFRQRTE